MKPSEKPLETSSEPSSDGTPPEPVWTKDIVFLVVLNIVLLIVIAVCLVVFVGAYQPLLSAWLHKVLGL